MSDQKGMGCWAIGAIVTAVLLGVFGLMCAGLFVLGAIFSAAEPPGPATVPDPVAAETPPEEPRDEPEPETPRDEPDRLIAYRVLQTDESSSGERLSFDVEVPLVDGRLPTQAELSAVSRHLKPADRNLVFVLFYLPGMTLDAGAFATAHHRPEGYEGVRVLRHNVPDEYRHLLE